MNQQFAARLWADCGLEPLTAIRRCAEGIGNYVYKIEAGGRYILRCSKEPNPYQQTIYWLEKLHAIGVPAPQVVKWGNYQGYEYLILTYIEGEDIGIAYPRLTTSEKQAIAREIVRIQALVGTLKTEVPSDWTWCTFISEMLDRAEERIAQNGYFDKEKVERLRAQASRLDDYFSSVTPVAYLDDISSKNLIIHEGRISGIIDVDWMGFGDPLTYVALTNMALLNLEYDTDYVSYILEEMHLSQVQRKAFLFYTLLYCVDFMGERGMQFMDKKIAVNQEIIQRLNGIYDEFWKEWN